ncbi:hypothetical protein ACR0U4_000865 [Enterobacter hormaechei]|uniref:hypothetical protein n=1 Tax=Enterobacter hormaechei TaxID=158836 RepID=UPI0010BE9EED|nr:hypothetical protein FCG85_016950 [Enterobacter hormaechei]
MECNVSELVKLGHDQVAELKSSCGAVDVRDVAQLISDLATQLDVQLARSNALAAENAGLKELIEQHANSVAVCPNCSHEEPSETDDIVALYRSMETPATDAFLVEVRAQGVEMFALMFAEEAIKSNNITTGWRAKASRAASEYAEALREDAAQLRKGVQS